MKFWCVRCPLSGGDYGPVEADDSDIYRHIRNFHKNCPGWGTTPPEPKLQEMVLDVDFDVKKAAKQARRYMQKPKKIRIDNDTTHSDIADMLMDDFDFLTLQDTERILIYRNGVYVSDGEAEIKKLCESHITDCDRGTVSEVIAAIQRRTLTTRDMFDADESLVCLKNCIIDIRTGIVIQHSPARLFRTQIPVTYDPAATCPKFCAFLRQCLPDSHDYIDQLEAFAVGLLKNTPKLEAMFFQTGKGDNGKSTFISILNSFYGDTNISTVSIHELLNNRFAHARLENRRYNTFPDIESDALENFGLLKAIVSGDAIDAERKYENPYTFKPYAKLMFSANELPDIRERTFATFKRIRLTKWSQQFLKPQEFKIRANILRTKFPEWSESMITEELHLTGSHEMNRQFVESIIHDEAEKSGILNLLLVCAKNIIKRDGFWNDYTHEQLNEMWSENATMIETTIHDTLVRDPDSYVEQVKTYMVYHATCRAAGKPPKPDNVFHPILKNLLNVETTYKKINGRTARVYLGYKWNHANPIVRMLKLVEIPASSLDEHV